MLNYFMHPSNLRNQEQLLELRINEHAAGYGIYLMILELLRDAPNYQVRYKPAHIAFAINETNPELVKRVCENYGLFVIDSNNMLSSEWLTNSMNKLDNKKDQYSAAGKKAAAARWGNTADNQAIVNDCKKSQCDVNAIALRPDATAMRNDANIINITNKKVHSPTPHVREWTVDGGRKMSIDELDDVARCKHDAINEKTIKIYAEKKDEDHNTTMICEICSFFGINDLQLDYIMAITNYGMIGGRETKELIQIYNKCKKDGFTAKFPMSYLLSQFSGYKNAK